MKLKPRQDALLVVTREQVTTVYETSVRRTTTYAVEIDHPLEKGKKVHFHEGDPLLLVVEDEEGEHFFFDTICLGLDDSASPALTLLFQHDFLKLPGRKLLRAIVNVPVRVTPLEPANTEPFGTQSINLSSGGILISSPYNLPEGAPVAMEITLSKKEEPLKVRGVRKRTEHPQGTGRRTFLLAFEFVQVGEKTRSRLSELVRRHCIKTYQRKKPAL